MPTKPTNDRRSARPARNRRNDQDRSRSTDQGRHVDDPANDDRLGVLLARDTAEELLSLVRDVEGDADEDLLDEAAVALHSATPGRLPHVPRGMLVLRVRPDERNLLLALIGDRPADERRIDRLGDRIAALLNRRH